MNFFYSANASFCFRFLGDSLAQLRRFHQTAHELLDVCSPVVGMQQDPFTIRRASAGGGGHVLRVSELRPRSRSPQQAATASCPSPPREMISVWNKQKRLKILF
jgi:hypothetical protein